MTDVLQQNLNQLMTDYVTAHQPELPQTDFDPQWLSPCQQAEPDEFGNIGWLPQKTDGTCSFSGLEDALGISLHPDIKAYYSLFWSECIDLHSSRGDLQLLFAWNQDDFERLQQNLIGHVLMKQRLGQQITLFFAVTDEEDFILSVNNESGEVVLEQVGCEPQEVLADNLAEFLSQLKPAI